MSTTAQLPSYIERIAKHLREKGWAEERAVAVAIRTAEKFCRTGDTNFPGIQHINAGSRSEACAAVAQLKGEPDVSKPEPVEVAGGVTDRPFDSSPARFSNTQWQRACVLDRGGDSPIKQRFSLPVREPDGALNLLAMAEATRRLGNVKASAAVIRAAARALVAAYREAGVQSPERLLRLAGMAAETAKATQPKTEQRDLEVVEERSAPLDAPPRIEGNKLCGVIPYGVESRDLGQWKERLEPGSATNAVKDDLVCTLQHDLSKVLGRFPGTLTIEDRSDALAWECELPNGPLGEQVRESVRRGDYRATSWRMVVGKDRWEGDLRVVEEIRELKDVALVANASYPTAAAELRSQPVRPPKEEPMEVKTEVETEEVEVEVEVEERSHERSGEGLTVEERTISPEEEHDVEARIHELISSTAKGEARSLTLTSGDAITPPQLSSYLWDRLAPQSVALRSGIRVIPTDRKTISWPQVVTDPAPEWVGETELIPATDPTFLTLEADPKKLAARTEFSNEVLDDSEPEAEGVVRRLMQRALALKLDIGFFQGNPATDDDSIRGLKFVSGIQEVSMGTNGAAITDLDLITDAVGMLEDADVPGPYAIVMRPQVWRQFTKLVDGQGRRLLGDFSRETPPNIDGHRVYTSNQLAANETQGTSNNCSSIYIYSTQADVGPALVRRKDVEILLDRSRLFDTDQSEMRAKTRVDLLVPQVLAVLRVIGVKPA